ncbi:hypothetical protein BJ742DRAFT_130720 [Cladochytrium replicatum]|nr:hypothetical protein BJ742DRAFT_130720 [Cladochytrium replicatum]
MHSNNSNSQKHSLKQQPSQNLHRPFPPPFIHLERHYSHLPSWIPTPPPDFLTASRPHTNGSFDPAAYPLDRNTFPQHPRFPPQNGDTFSEHDRHYEVTQQNGSSGWSGREQAYNHRRDSRNPQEAYNTPGEPTESQNTNGSRWEEGNADRNYRAYPGESRWEESEAERIYRSQRQPSVPQYRSSEQPATQPSTNDCTQYERTDRAYTSELQPDYRYQRERDRFQAYQYHLYKQQWEQYAWEQHQHQPRGQYAYQRQMMGREQQYDREYEQQRRFAHRMDYHEVRPQPSVNGVEKANGIIHHNVDSNTPSSSSSASSSSSTSSTSWSQTPHAHHDTNGTHGHGTNGTKGTNGHAANGTNGTHWVSSRVKKHADPHLPVVVVVLHDRKGQSRAAGDPDTSNTNSDSNEGWEEDRKVANGNHHRRDLDGAPTATTTADHRAQNTHRRSSATVHPSPRPNGRPNLDIPTNAHDPSVFQPNGSWSSTSWPLNSWHYYHHHDHDHYHHFHQPSTTYTSSSSSRYQPYQPPPFPNTHPAMWSTSSSPPSVEPHYIEKYGKQQRESADIEDDEDSPRRRCRSMHLDPHPSDSMPPAYSVPPEYTVNKTCSSSTPQVSH